MDTRIPILTASAVAAVVGHRAYDRLTHNWGATPAERATSLPGDDFLPHPGPASTMGITITAPPEAIWPWLVQMGVDRAGLYTHTWVENGLLRLNVSNADRIVPEWQDLKIGDRMLFMRGNGSRPEFGPAVVAFEPNRSLVLSLGEVNPATALGTWQFFLEPEGECCTRLLLRSRGSTRRPMAVKLMDAVLEPGYQYMDIGMLEGIRERAERLSPPVPAVALA
jgi:hypothetical protein